jgi:hypothetical protein
LSNTKIDAIAAELTGTFVKQLQEQIAKQVTADVAYKLAQIDIQKTVRDYVNEQLSGLIQNVNFPDASIPGTAISLEKFLITGNNVVGGIIQNFGSTGIQDGATACQVTILDEATVIENKLLARELEVKGNLTVDGDLILTGEIPTSSPFYKDLVQHAAGLLKLSMDGQFFLQYADKVFDKIKADGIDLTKLTINGNEILSGNRLGYSITDTNIQKVGELRSITVNGDANLSGSVFARNKRVGINTEEPAGALAVWDEECEIVTRKLRKDVAIIGSLRNQRVVLSANSKENLTLETDGSISVSSINIGRVQIGSAIECPSHDAKRGLVIFNELPDFGKPMFWISLGNARWANGPIIG